MGRDLRVKGGITLNRSTSQWQNMSYCLSAVLSVEKSAGEMFRNTSCTSSQYVWASLLQINVYFLRADGKLPLWSCKDSNISFKQSAQRTADLSGVRCCIRTSFVSSSVLRRRHRLDCRLILLFIKRSNLFFWHIFMTAVNCYHDEVDEDMLRCIEMWHGQSCVYVSDPWCRWGDFCLMPEGKRTYYRYNKRVPRKKRASINPKQFLSPATFSLTVCSFFTAISAIYMCPAPLWKQHSHG